MFTNQPGLRRTGEAVPGTDPVAKAQAIVVIFGERECLHGKQGLRMRARCATSWRAKLNVARGSVLVGSTGRIGVTLPMQNIRRGISDAVGILAARRNMARKSPKRS